MLQENEIVTGEKRGIKMGKITVCLYVAWEQFSREVKIDDVGEK